MAGNKSNEYSVLLDELKTIRKECADGHAQTETAIAVFNSQMGTINDQLAQIQHKVDPLINLVSVHDKDIKDAERDIQNVFGMLGDVKDRVRDVSISSPGSIKPESFWDGPNARLVLLIGAVFVIGLFGLAGYNMSIKDLTP